MASLTLLTISGYPTAKHYLVEHGRTAAEVEAMPVAQVVLLYTVKLYDELSDDQFKWFYLPASEGEQGTEARGAGLREALASQAGDDPLGVVLASREHGGKEAETRRNGSSLLLRIFEAMRLYAANHGGRWPDHLSDITEVPVPVNPYDGKPFLYERHGDKAVVDGRARPDELAPAYEITLKQKRN